MAGGFGVLSYTAARLIVRAAGAVCGKPGVSCHALALMNRVQLGTERSIQKTSIPRACASRSEQENNKRNGVPTFFEATVRFRSIADNFVGTTRPG